MDFLKAVDGSKTYILAVATGVLTLVHFMVTSDYSMASFITLSQDTTVIAMIAALRHAISKSVNQGAISTGTTLTTQTISTQQKVD